MATKKINFETALSELESIVSSLEQGELELDTSLELYQKGVELAKFCNKKLEDAENKITILLEKENGQIVEEPFGKN